MTEGRALKVTIEGQRLHLVRNVPPYPLVAEYGSPSMPPAVTAMFARQAAVGPEMVHLLLEAAQHFRDHPKAARKAGRLPERIMALLRELEMDGWVS